jgi:O-antigen ligase
MSASVIPFPQRLRPLLFGRFAKGHERRGNLAIWRNSSVRVCGVNPARNSIFNLHDPTISERLAMMRARLQIIRAHPGVGVGPNMIARIYPQYRDPDSVLPSPPHLHNVPLQIAAERGLPAVALWIWSLVPSSLALPACFATRREKGPSAFSPPSRSPASLRCSPPA